MNALQRLIIKAVGGVIPDPKPATGDAVKALQQIRRKAGVPQEDRPLQRSSMIIGQAIPPDMKMFDYLKAYMGWVFACVNVISQETADIDLTLYRRTGQNNFSIVDNHPVLDLLYKVNPLYTSYLLWESTQAFMDLTGEAFWWLTGPTKRPTEIWVLRPDWVNIRDTKGSIVLNYEYGPPGDHKIAIPFEQIVQFKDFNPTNMYRGFGHVKASAKSIDEDEFQKDYSRTFFYNSALPGGALETDQSLTDEQYTKVRDDWEAVHRGSKKAWKVAILEAGLKWQDIGMNRKEMDFIEGRRLTRDEIMAMFRVPKPLLTFDDVNRAAAKEARAILLENVVTHKMKRIVSFLNEFLLPRYGDDSLFFDFKNPVPNDQASDVNYYKAALGGAPWMTQNEVREREDMDPIDGGDALNVPFSLAPAGQQSDAQKKLQSFRKSLVFNVRIPTYSYLKYQMDELQVKLERLAENMLRAILKKKDIHNEPHIKAIKAEEADIVEDPAREARSKAFIARTDPREAKYTHLLNELFVDQKDAVVSRLENDLTKSIDPETKKFDAEKVKGTVTDVADVTGDNDVFIHTLMDFVKTVIEAEGIEQIQSILKDGIFLINTKEVQRFLTKDGAKYISAINEETSSLLRNTLSDGIAAQESIPQLAARVSAVYDDAVGYRATRIARSEVLRASNFAANEAYRQSKVVDSVEWLTAHDERVCPWCGPLDGKQIQVGETFVQKGDTLSGKNENGTTVKLTIGVGDIDYPPLHPNCRCTTIPIVSNDNAKKPEKTKTARH